MSLSLVQSRALVGLAAERVTVEVHLANGLPSFTLVGLAETEVKEARERVRSALLTCGLDFPHSRRITVNLAPADLPKDSGRFDLPIALGILAASDQIDGARLAQFEFAGELSLTGELRPVRGALAMSLALQTAGGGVQLVLPPGSADEAALVPGAIVWRARHLMDVVAQLQPGDAAAAAAATDGWQRLQPAAPAAEAGHGDLAEVKGQAAAKRALEIAAAGGHAVLLVGPPGAGKSMLARRFAGLLPPMAVQEALESAAVASLAGRFDLARWAVRPTCSPHHSASAVALVGGGSPPRPGEISLAHRGVLFLDELPEFSRAALEALREPLETGHITIARAARRAEFPASFQFIAAMNPCPCGWLARRTAPAAARRSRWTATRAGCPGHCSTASTCMWTWRRCRRRSCSRHRAASPRPACASAAWRRGRAPSRARARPTTRCCPARSTSMCPSMQRAAHSCSARPCAWAGARVPRTGCSRSRARWPTWPAAAASRSRTWPKPCSTGARAPEQWAPSQEVRPRMQLPRARGFRSHAPMPHGPRPRSGRTLAGML